jgi:putative MFS transporter
MDKQGLGASSPASATAAAPGTAQLQLAAEMLVARLERLPFTRKHAGIFAVLGTATLFDGLDLVMIGICLPLIIATFHITIAQAGPLIASLAWGATIGALGVGLIAERWGRRNALLVSCVVMGLGALIAVFAQDLNSLIVARVIQGIGVGAEIPIAGAMFSEFQRGKSRGLFGMLWESLAPWGGIVANVVLFIFVQLKFGNDAWRGLFAFSALSMLVIFARSRFLPESPRWLINQGRLSEATAIIEEFEASARRSGQALGEPVPVPQPKVQKTNPRELFGQEYRGRTLMACVWIGLTYFNGYGLAPLTTTFLVTLGGLDLPAAIGLGTLQVWIYLVWQYICAATLDRFGRRFWMGWIQLWSVAVYLVAAYIVGVLGIHTWQVIWGAAVLSTLGVLPATTGFYVYTPELFPTRLRA